MNSIKGFAVGAVTAAVLLGLGGCDTMSSRDTSTAVGVGVGTVAGAVTGAVLSGGSAVDTVGGAAVGGVVGNQVGKGK